MPPGVQKPKPHGKGTFTSRTFKRYLVFVFSMSNVLLYALIPILLNQYALTKKKLKELKLKTSFWSRHGLNLKVFRLIV